MWVRVASTATRFNETWRADDERKREDVPNSNANRALSRRAVLSPASSESRAISGADREPRVCAAIELARRRILTRGPKPTSWQQSDATQVPAIEVSATPALLTAMSVLGRTAYIQACVVVTTQLLPPNALTRFKRRSEERFIPGGQPPSPRSREGRRPRREASCGRPSDDGSTASVPPLQRRLSQAAEAAARGR